MKRYFAKPDVWYDAGTEAFLIPGTENNPPNAALFCGTKDGKLDEEYCRFDEFDVVEWPDIVDMAL